MQCRVVPATEKNFSNGDGIFQKGLAPLSHFKKSEESD
jgi:hypothetical protein